MKHKNRKYIALGISTIRCVIKNKNYIKFTI
jgi:hypothetical protein